MPRWPTPGPVIANSSRPPIPTTQRARLDECLAAEFYQPADILSTCIQPRAPVYLSNTVTHVVENRFYLDLNRNGKDDPNGLLPVISPDPANRITIQRHRHAEYHSRGIA